MVSIGSTDDVCSGVVCSGVMVVSACYILQVTSYYYGFRNFQQMIFFINSAVSHLEEDGGSIF